MLRYLTHKLRTQSLNESEHFHSKGNEDHDSGTESDDENADIEELQKYMENSILLGSRPQTRSHGRRGSSGNGLSGPGGDQLTSGDAGRSLQQPSSRAGSKSEVDSPLPLDSALPSDSDHNFDHHSSEEELEVINCAQVGKVPVVGQSAASAEKRKWSQANRLSLSENSSDEEIRELVCFSTPVEFRTSPPANVHKPSRSPPPKVFHSANLPPHELCSVSPRKRHRRTPTTHTATGATASSSAIQRPCLDFEKMQQIRVRLV